MMRTSRGLRSPFIVSALLALGVAACDGEGTTSSGSGGSGGSVETTSTTSTTCLTMPVPEFTLRVLEASGGPLPPDTTVEVMWSAGPEPPFHLDQPQTWGTLETSNVLCDVDPAAPPADLHVLSCVLWTASPTEVRVSAMGYVTQEHTYAAEPMDVCAPEPTPIEIELEKAPL